MYSRPPILSTLLHSHFQLQRPSRAKLTTNLLVLTPHHTTDPPLLSLTTFVTTTNSEYPSRSPYQPRISTADSQPCPSLVASRPTRRTLPSPVRLTPSASPACLVWVRRTVAPVSSQPPSTTPRPSRSSARVSSQQSAKRQSSARCASRPTSPPPSQSPRLLPRLPSPPRRPTLTCRSTSSSSPTPLALSCASPWLFPSRTSHLTFTYPWRMALQW